MAACPTTAPGRVSATPERPLGRDGYDIVILGGGVLGAAVADRLRSLLPERSLLLVEAEGLPNEGGATVASPGLIPPLAAREVGPEAPRGALAPAGGAVPDRDRGQGGAEHEALAWARDWAEAALPGGAAAAGRERSGPGWLALAGDGAAGGGSGRGAAAASGARPIGELLPAATVALVGAMTGARPDRPGWLLDGGYLPVEALALALARRAVRAGADLALNARARPLDPGRLVLDRLAVDRRMRVGVHARQVVTAGTVVVACGAAGAAVAENGLDRTVSLPSAYVQFPRVRVELPADVRLPVISMAGWAWRPAAGGAMLVPPAPAPDPEGFVPVGGRVLGVPVGLRRELVDRMLAEPALAALLDSGRLELGKSVRAVRGARFSLPGGGGPVAERLAETWWLLAGGTRGVAADLAAAARLAGDIAGAAPPWRGAPAEG